MLSEYLSDEDIPVTLLPSENSMRVQLNSR